MVHHVYTCSPRNAITLLYTFFCSCSYVSRTSAQSVLEIMLSRSVGYDQQWQLNGPIKGTAAIHLWKWEISADLCSWETDICSTIFANCNVYIGWAYIEVRSSCSYNIISQPIVVVYSTTKKQRRWKFLTKVCTIFMYISVSVTMLLEMLYTWVHANLHCNHRWKLKQLFLQLQ